MTPAEKQAEACREMNYRPRPMAAYFAGRCACGATWRPGDVVFRPLLPRGARVTCFDCGLRAAEASK